MHIETMVRKKRYVPFASGALALLMLCWVLCRGSDWVRAASLDDAFRNPPPQARPWVYWFWMNGNVTKEGITADLEAMARVGIGGALIMTVTQDIPPGPVKYLSPEWRELFRHAAAEADRLGLELTLNNDDGWCGSGGPWIRPEQAMQQVVWSETRVEGTRGQGLGARGQRVVLPQPPTQLGFYRDVAVLAFPTPAAGVPRMVDANPEITGSSADFDGGNLMDGDTRTGAMVPLPPTGGLPFVQFEFDKPFAARALTVVASSVKTSPSRGELQVSDDGKRFCTVSTFSLGWKPNRMMTSITVGFERTEARVFRLLMSLPALGIIKRPEADRRVEIAELELLGSPRVHFWEGKAGFARIAEHGGGFDVLRTGPPVTASLPPETVIARNSIVDLTARMEPQGQVTWDVPPGDWTILRIGYTPTGQKNHPATPEGEGLECDKLSRAGIAAHFPGLVGTLIRDAGPLVGKSFRHTHIDSWEVGCQNWTAALAHEFRKRRGYDLVPFLPAMAGGRVVESLEVSERFLWDLRRTLADLIADEYLAAMRDLCHEHGLRFQTEACGRQQFMYDPLSYHARSDLPMGEFWVGGGPRVDCKVAASIAHTENGSTKWVGAEAFTSAPIRWQEDPFSLKALGDQAFSIGVNRFYFHRYAMQPWLDCQPGFTMGKWGIHFERTNTWWEQGAAWMTYLARCSFLLAQGQFAGDVLVFTGEDVPNYLGWREEIEPPIPAGYDYDGAGTETLARLSVKDGRLVLPGGMSYRVLLLPNTDAMTPPTLRKVRELVHSGATVVGPKPVRSPSLAEYPRCDDEVRRLAEELWGDSTAKGRIIWGKAFPKIFESLGLVPDFECLTLDVSLRYIHRRTQDADIYFISNPEQRPVAARCAFRVSGKSPELWHPDSGRIAHPALWQQRDGRTLVPIRFDPSGSVFTVFRRQAPGPRALACRLAAITKDGQTPNELEPTIELEAAGRRGTILATFWANGTYELRPVQGEAVRLTVRDVPAPLLIGGPWEVAFDPNWGGPDEPVVFRSLDDWSKRPEEGIRYYSGTAAYHAAFDLADPSIVQDRRFKIFLDLGAVKNLAEVTLNGRDLGVLWKPPFRLEVAGGVKAAGNAIEIHVTNLWANRLIGDEQLPADCTFTEPGSLAEWPRWLLEGKPRPTARRTFTTWKHYTKDDLLLESGLLGPVTLQAALSQEIHF